MGRKFRPGDRVWFKRDPGESRKVSEKNIAVVMSFVRDPGYPPAYDIAWPGGDIGMAYADELEKAPVPKPSPNPLRWTYS